MVNNEKLSREFQERCQFVSEVRCAGRCDIDLGEITKHNVMVCFSYFNDIAKKFVSAIKDVEYGCLPGKQSCINTDIMINDDAYSKKGFLQ
jgi:hypothetical protein